MDHHETKIEEICFGKKENNFLMIKNKEDILVGVITMLIITPYPHHARDVWTRGISKLKLSVYCRKTQNCPFGL